LANPSPAGLTASINHARLLEPAQAEELTRDLQTRFPTAQALAQELVNRSWLTPFQVEQLLRGQARELNLGEYLVLEKLGEGGMGRVYKARHRPSGRLVALKVIKPEFLTNPETVRRFRREARSLAQLSHPNIVAATEVGSIDGRPFIALELIQGTDLFDLVLQAGPLPIAQACDYFHQAALGLHHLHEQGLIHRDIAPTNFLVTANPAPSPPSQGGVTEEGSPEGVVKLLDLGLTRLETPAPSKGSSVFNPITLKGTVMGTPDYIAPEQAIDLQSATAQSDIYSLGATFYFCLTGQPPFPGGNALEKCLRHRKEEPAPVTNLRPEVPPALAQLVRQMMAKAPAQRPQTAAEVAAALEQCQYEAAAGISSEERVPVIAMSDLPFAEPMSSPLRTRGGKSSLAPWWLAAAGLAVIAVAVWLILKFV
jgi:serine/threonine-protein kinase